MMTSVWVLFVIVFHSTYSNLPNNHVGPFNHVGGRFLRNQSGFEAKISEINKRVGPNKVV